MRDRVYRNFQTSVRSPKLLVSLKEGSKLSKVKHQGQVDNSKPKRYPDFQTFLSSVKFI